METTPNPEASAAVEVTAAETTPETKATGAESTTPEGKDEGKADKPEEKKDEESKAATIKAAVVKVNKEFAAAEKEVTKAEAKEATDIKKAEAEGKAAPEKKGLMANWRAAQKDWLNKRYGLTKDEKGGGAPSGGGGPDGFIKTVLKFAKHTIMLPLYAVGVLYIAVENAIEGLNNLVNGKKK